MVSRRDAELKAWVNHGFRRPSTGPEEKPVAPNAWSWPVAFWRSCQAWGPTFQRRGRRSWGPTASDGYGGLTSRQRGSNGIRSPLTIRLAGAYLPIDSPTHLRQMRRRAASGFVEPWAVTGSNRRPPACKVDLFADGC